MCRSSRSRSRRRAEAVADRSVFRHLHSSVLFHMRHQQPAHGGAQQPRITPPQADIVHPAAPAPTLIQPHRRPEPRRTTRLLTIIAALAASLTIITPASHNNAVAAAGSSAVEPLVPARLLDTRDGQPTVDGAATGGGPVPANTPRRIQVTGRGEVPAGAAGVTGNITITNPTHTGWGTAYPCGEPPLVSNVSYTAHTTTAGSIVTTLDDSGGLCIRTSATTDVVFDVTGWIPASGGIDPILPIRIADTRPGSHTIDQQATGHGIVTAGHTLHVPVTGRATLGDPAGIVVAVTITQPDDVGHVTVHACDQSRPHASTLNYQLDTTVSNLAWSDLSDTGTICIYTTTNTHIIVDAVATIAHGAEIEPITAARLADSRPAQPTTDATHRGFGPLQQDQHIAIDIAGRGPIDRRATAAAVTVTAVAPTHHGHITIYPCDRPRPHASTLNYRPGQTIAATTWTTLTTSGQLCVYTHATTHIVIDINAVQLPPTVALAAGGDHTCTTHNGTVRCWGRNHLGQLGNGTTTPHTTPVTAHNITTAASITTGAAHTCTTLDNGTVRCWGYNAHGQLGDTTTTNRTTPTPIPNLTNTTTIAAGDYHTCALTNAGQVWCWGDNTYGQLGNGPNPDQQPTPTPIPNLTDITDIAAAGDTTCALHDTGTISCWGYNADGQLGNNTTTNQPTPTPVANLTNIAGITVGLTHTCAWQHTGTGHCWGNNTHGQLGTGDHQTTLAPTPVTGLGTTITTIATGSGTHTCATTTQHTTYCWGNNTHGQLGTGNYNPETAPTPTAGLPPISTITTGDHHTCAQTTQNTTWCWGNNQHQQLATDNPTDNPTPQPIP